MEYNLIKEILSYTPEDVAQQDIKAKFLEFLESDEKHFCRENLKRHITASALLLNKNRDKVLLTLHKKLGAWLQLGGHSDGDPNTLQVAIKECQEESGIELVEPLYNNIFDLDIHTIPKHKDIPEHLHYDVRFVITATTEVPFVISDESLDLKWFDIDYVAKNNGDYAVRRLAQKLSRLFATHEAT